VQHRYQWCYLYPFAHPPSGRTVWLLLPTDLPPIIFGDGMKKQAAISIPDLECRHVNRQILFQSKREGRATFNRGHVASAIAGS
jgi:hypothetical protein